jgi:hypothetical protein
MKSLVPSRTVRVLPVTGYYQNNYSIKFSVGKALEKMGNNEMSKRIMDSKLKGSSKVGRPKLRWMDGVVRYLGIQRW